MQLKRLTRSYDTETSDTHHVDTQNSNKSTTLSIKSDASVIVRLTSVMLSVIIPGVVAPLTYAADSVSVGASSGRLSVPIFTFRPIKKTNLEDTTTILIIILLIMT